MIAGKKKRFTTAENYQNGYEIIHKIAECPYIEMLPYARMVYGYESQMHIYNVAKIARKFVVKDGDEYHTVFKTIDGRDFNYACMVALKEKTVEEIQAALANGVITLDESSTSIIRKVKAGVI